MSHPHRDLPPIQGFIEQRCQNRPFRDSHHSHFDLCKNTEINLTHFVFTSSTLFTRLGTGVGDCPRGTFKRPQIEHVDICVLVHFDTHVDHHTALPRAQLPLSSNGFETLPFSFFIF